MQRTVQEMGVEQVLTAFRAPWQNRFAERLIGSLRRECLDQVIVWNERALRRYLSQYLTYYHTFRTYLALEKDAPISRQVQLPTAGVIVEIAHLGGLHHHYELPGCLSASLEDSRFLGLLSSCRLPERVPVEGAITSEERISARRLLAFIGQLSSPPRARMEFLVWTRATASLLNNLRNLSGSVHSRSGESKRARPRCLRSSSFGFSVLSA